MKGASLDKRNDKEEGTVMTNSQNRRGTNSLQPAV